MDTEQHQVGTGRGNELILANAGKVAHKARVWLRVPVLCGYNDSEENIGRLAELGKQMGVEKVSLLPYHRWGESKYEQLGMQYSWHGEEPDPNHLRDLQVMIQGYGLTVTVGN